MGSISLGMALVAGKNRVPSPPTGKIAFLIIHLSPKVSWNIGLSFLQSSKVYVANIASAKPHCHKTDENSNSE